MVDTSIWDMVSHSTIRAARNLRIVTSAYHAYLPQFAHADPALKLSLKMKLSVARSVARRIDQGGFGGIVYRSTFSSPSHRSKRPKIVSVARFNGVQIPWLGAHPIARWCRVVDSCRPPVIFVSVPRKRHWLQHAESSRTHSV